MRWEPKDKTLWHRWFAWYPVMINDTEAVWLQTVQRRLTYLWAGTISEYKDLD